MINPVLVTIGPLQIRWYGVTALLGVAAAFWYIKKVCKFLDKSGEKKLIYHIEKMIVPLVIIGLVGARMYHVINEPSFYFKNPLMIGAIWHGGLAIHGGVFTGALYLWYYVRKHRLHFLEYADIFMPALMAGQAIGRFGNFFNQELFGKPTELPWGIFIDSVNRPRGFAQFTHFHPTFLYESLWNLIAIIIIILWIKKQPPKKQGVVLGSSLVIWGIGRVLTELLRIDDVPIILGTRLPLLMSVGVIVLGVGILVYLYKSRGIYITNKPVNQ